MTLPGECAFSFDLVKAIYLSVILNRLKIEMHVSPPI